MSAFSAASAADTIHCQLPPFPRPPPLVPPNNAPNYSLHLVLMARRRQMRGKSPIWPDESHLEEVKRHCCLTGGGGFKPEREKINTAGAHSCPIRKNHISYLHSQFGSRIYIPNLHPGFKSSFVMHCIIIDASYMNIRHGDRLGMGRNAVSVWFQ